MNLKVIHEVPKEFGDPYLDLVGGEILRILYERRGKKFRAALRFNQVAAIQMRALDCAEEWQDDSYFTLVEVFDSPWKQNVLDAVPEQEAAYRDRKRHYAILGLYISYEFLADSWEMLPEKEGWGDFPREETY